MVSGLPKLAARTSRICKALRRVQEDLNKLNDLMAECSGLPAAHGEPQIKTQLLDSDCATTQPPEPPEAAFDSRSTKNRCRFTESQQPHIQPPSSPASTIDSATSCDMDTAKIRPKFPDTQQGHDHPVLSEAYVASPHEVYATDTAKIRPRIPKSQQARRQLPSSSASSASSHKVHGMDTTKIRPNIPKSQQAQGRLPSSSATTASSFDSHDSDTPQAAKLDEAQDLKEYFAEYQKLYQAVSASPSHADDPKVVRLMEMHKRLSELKGSSAASSKT